MNPRDEFLLSEPEETQIPPYLDPSVEPEFLTVESSADLLEHTMIQTILDIMSSGKRDSDRRAAARDAGELIGKINQKQSLNLISADNVQLNQLNGNPEMKRHLIESAAGLSKISNASKSSIKTHKGGGGV